MATLTHIPVIIDKSHLLTIGERLYATSLDLIRELVSNAYDADATRVDITLSPEEVIVRDNGSGMDEEGLRQYFTIGSQEKRRRPTSPRFHRTRIGEFGIGKFSALTIARRFEIETRHMARQFRARLVFDAARWQDETADWNIPCEVLAYLPEEPGGTTLSLRGIKKQLDPGHVVRHIRERLPIGKDDFHIFVNGAEVSATTIPGRRYPVSFATPYGAVDGEIILANLPFTQRTAQDAGITIRVKQIAITKALFGYEGSHAVGINRLRGWINADFLPITSSRDQVIQDADEYRSVSVKMREHLGRVLRDAKNFALNKENVQASRMLRDALDKIGRAVKRNPEVFQEERGDPSLGAAAMPGPNREEGYVISRAEFVDSAGGMPSGMIAPMNTPGADEKKPIRRKHLGLANRAIIRKMHFANLGIVCRMERFGPRHPPSFFEQGIIYLNIDHPLYRKQMDHEPLLTMFLSGLIAKELALKRHPHDAGAAYEFQYHLLTDAFQSVRQW